MMAPRHPWMRGPVGQNTPTTLEAEPAAKDGGMGDAAVEKDPARCKGDDARQRRASSTTTSKAAAAAVVVEPG